MITPGIGARSGPAKSRARAEVLLPRRRSPNVALVEAAARRWAGDPDAMLRSAQLALALLERHGHASGLVAIDTAIAVAKAAVSDLWDTEFPYPPPAGRR